MKRGKKIKQSDVIIVARLGEAARDFYGDDYERIKQIADKKNLSRDNRILKDEEIEKLADYLYGELKGCVSGNSSQRKSFDMGELVDSGLVRHYVSPPKEETSNTIFVDKSFADSIESDKELFVVDSLLDYLKKFELKKFFIVIQEAGIIFRKGSFIVSPGPAFSVELIKKTLDVDFDFDEKDSEQVRITSRNGLITLQFKTSKRLVLINKNTRQLHFPVSRRKSIFKNIHPGTYLVINLDTRAVRELLVIDKVTFEPYGSPMGEEEDHI